MKRAFLSLSKDVRAASAAEFALVLPLLLLFLLGMLDVGRLMWTWNRAEKATQMGVRYAIVTDMVAGGFASYGFVNNSDVTQGDAVSTTVFSSLDCNLAQNCSCTGTGCESDWTLDTDAFNDLVSRMQLFLPEIQPENVEVTYTNVGLGYAGDPNGPDVAPLVTVKFRQDNPITFQPITFMLFNSSITLPDFSAALTLEDGSGTYSN